MMLQYSAYGLGFHSDIALPELFEAAIQADVLVHLEPEQSNPPSQNNGWISINLHEAVYFHELAGQFTIRNGQEVIISPLPGTRQSLIRIFLLGQVMAALLYQRGNLVLHASSVEMKGQVIAFLGDSRFGKSSIAAAMVKRGHRLLADDITAINLNSRPFKILPGIPRIKVDREVAKLLDIDKNQLSTIDPLEHRGSWEVPEETYHSKNFLNRIVILDHGPEPKVLPIRPHEAVIELVRNAFPTRFAEQGDPVQLQQCAFIAKDLNAYRLVRPQNLKFLPILVEMIEEEFALQVYS